MVLFGQTRFGQGVRDFAKVPRWWSTCLSPVAPLPANFGFQSIFIPSLRPQTWRAIGLLTPKIKTWWDIVNVRGVAKFTIDIVHSRAMLYAEFFCSRSWIFHLCFLFPNEAKSFRFEVPDFTMFNRRPAGSPFLSIFGSDLLKRFPNWIFSR